MIDVIIPAYNAHDTINKTLISIAMQTIKDKLNIYVVNDNSSKDYENEINLFKDKLKIKELKLNKNVGPGFARQYGIDNSHSKYIIFIDSDDVFYDIYSLENILNYAEKYDADLTVGIMVEECDDELIEYENHQGNLHGKLYKRSFLSDNNIRFNNTRSSEDNSFNSLVLLLKPKVWYCERYIYVYRNNKNSITRKDNNYAFDSIMWYTYNIVWALKEAEKRQADNILLAELSLLSFSWIYFNYCAFYEYEEKDKIIDWTKELYKYYLKYGDLLGDANKYTILFDYFKDPPTVKLNDFLSKFE